MELKDILELPDQALLRPDEAAALLRTSREALAVRRCEGSGPGYFKMGRFIRYRKADVLGWAEPVEAA